MFFVFIFIFVKICSTHAIASDADDSDTPPSRAAFKEETRSPPRKIRAKKKTTTNSGDPSSEEEAEPLKPSPNRAKYSKPPKSSSYEDDSDGTDGEDSDEDEPSTLLLKKEWALHKNLPPRHPSAKKELAKLSKKKTSGKKAYPTPAKLEEDGDTDDSSGDDLFPNTLEKLGSATRTVSGSESSAGRKSSVSIFDLGSDDEDDDALVAALTPSKGASSTDGSGTGESPTKLAKGKLSPEQSDRFFKGFDLTPRRVAAIERRNQALYLKEGEPDFDAMLSEIFDPSERQAIIALKAEYASPIRSPRLEGKILTPALRAHLNRLAINAAKEAGLAESWPADASKEPHIPETEEEKAARRKHQEELFLELEGARGKSSAELSAEIAAEYKLWENHFAYIQRRKTEATSGTGSKIRKNEIIETFERFVKPHYQMVEVEGYEVYFSLESLDLGRIDSKKCTNLQRLARSLCPIGPDRETMNYHHLTHHDAKTHAGKSVIVLIINKLHTQFSASLHFKEGTYRDLPRTPLDRSEFGRMRTLFGLEIAKHIQENSA